MTHLLHTPTSPTKHQSLINQSHSPLHRETNRLGLNTPPTQSTLKTNHYTKIQQLFLPINTTPMHPMGRLATIATTTILNLPHSKMPPKPPNPHKRKAPPKKPPNPTPDNPNDGTTRTNITLGTAGTISSVSPTNEVPKPTALGGYHKKKM